MPENHNKDYIKTALETAWTNFLNADFYLLEHDVNERSITHKFAEHLTSQFPTWHVDCEYNKDGNSPKRVHISPIQIGSDNDKGETAYPDIIVHERGTENNLLVIEAKKDTNNSYETKTKDMKKLAAYKVELNYKFGLFIKFNTGGRYSDKPKMEWVISEEGP
jgi:hypothetical protein